MLVFVLAVLVLFPQSSVVAQDSPIDILKYLPGIESAYSRRYHSAAELFGFPASATPETSGTPVSTSTALVDATVLEFIDEATLVLTWTTMMNDEFVTTLAGNPEGDFSTSRVDGLGDQAILGFGQGDHDDDYGAILVIRDGNLGFIIMATGTDESILETVRLFGEHMVTAEPGTEPVTLSENADSSGGIFDVFPGAHDTEILGPLVPAHDYDLLVDGGSPVETDATPDD